MERTDLKKCPFCGGEAYIVKEHDGEWYKGWYAVSCENCYAKIEDERVFMCDREKLPEKQIELIEKELTEKWNRRANDGTSR